MVLDACVDIDLRRLVLAAGPKPLTAAQLNDAKKDGDVVTAHAFSFDGPKGRWQLAPVRVTKGFTIVLTAPNGTKVRETVDATNVRGVTFVNDGDRLHVLLLLEKKAKPVVRFFLHQSESYAREAPIETELEKLLPDDTSTELARAIQGSPPRGADRRG